VGRTIILSKVGIPAVLFATAILLVCGVAQADTDVAYNLKRTRDALLGQRQELLNAQHAVEVQLNELQQRNDRINAYLRDTDNSLRDVETALRTTK
jgi:Na+-transporting NADH:ubiquinone oxidoreductase subunit NqrC